ncbi:MAG: hypothetical protein MUF36_06765 [Bacteroidales bacterium]|jgi:hypothetical protein|nr:hypothetical protein [Bacteroidales bacterium]
MVLVNYKRAVSGSAFFLLMAILFSCDEVLFVNCSECVTDQLEEAYIKISHDLNTSGVDITIYSGNIKDSVIFGSYRTFGKTSYFRVLLNNCYIVTAEYNIEGKRYVAVNTVMPKVTLEEEQCNDPCYFVYNRDVDLRLKYLN